MGDDSPEDWNGAYVGATTMIGPMPNPKYAVSVVIENGESGGSVAGPVAIAVLNNLLKNE